MSLAEPVAPRRRPPLTPRSWRGDGPDRGLGSLARRLSSPASLARIVFLTGLVTLLSAATPSAHGRLALVQSWVPDVIPAAATTGALAFGALMMGLAGAIRRGKRRAWLVCAIVTAGTVVLDLAKGLDVEAATGAIVLLVLLWIGRAQFVARPDPRSLRRVAAVTAIGFVIATALGLLWLTLDVDGQAPGTSMLDRLLTAAAGLVGVPGPVGFVDQAHQASAAVGLAVLGAVLLAVVTLTLLRSADGPHPMTEPEAARARQLVDLWGEEDSLAYFATRGDRSLILNPDGRAGVSYRVLGSVSLAAGDPIGDRASWVGAVEAWIAECDDFGWTPAVLAASASGSQVYAGVGLEALELGDEAVVDTTSFTLDGRAMRGVRQAVSRCTRAGITATCRRVGDLDDEERRELAAMAEAWREGETERGYSMALGRFLDAADPDAVVVVARDEEGNPRGLLNLVPWGLEGLSLDLMRRDRTAVNGVIELMIATVCLESTGLGVRRVSLNFAVFRSVFARTDEECAGRRLRAWCSVLRYLSRYWQIESLYRSNAKYHPSWQPRFVCYRRAADLPRIGTTALRAEAFLTRPRWWPTGDLAAPRSTGRR